MADVFERVRSALVDLIAVRPEEVVPGASLVEDLGVDSQDFIRLMLALEDEFSENGRVFEISDDEVKGIETVQQIVEMLQRRGVG